MEIDEPVIAHPANVTDLPPIDTVDREIVREVWNQPRIDADIQMDATKAREVCNSLCLFKFAL